MSIVSLSSQKQPPPWQVVVLVATHLDPKTLAISSCVCKTWLISMSLDQIWQPLCCSHYPSLSTLHNFNNNNNNNNTDDDDSSVSYRRYSPSVRGRVTSMETAIKTLHGNQLSFDKKGVFRFDIDVEQYRRRISGSVTNIKNEDMGSFDTLGDVRIMWDVILEGYNGVFNVMNCKGKGKFVLGLEGWFSEELPPPGCCSIETVSGLVADLRLGLKLEDEKQWWRK
ncbi:hypothetical protein H5410_020762 [Solanum commersonii]|uniref:F-box protein n=1 Tax=Solanum commersonii TaxID=4109 RepID=A0A9J5Z9D4_SOLCO|nr:hypothetical protein H5410_020762 [Solanum commersonii]